MESGEVEHNDDWQRENTCD